ncbi:MAG: conjugal transfer protein TraX [Bacillus sp. (in: Bacteria)]|nr:conjugal transfer protein TraX [Bacillus sp. (in: firmicutes)]MCM1427647.1 conjugal transfer protein TraX [Eubacterium sp.]
MDNAMIANNERGFLNRNQIKYIVIIAMLIDHIAWGFVDAVNPLLGGCMHFIGRLTGPTMAYFVGEGYRYTRDVGKYQQRLALFALISWIPFVWFEYGKLPFYFEQGRLMFIPVQSVIFTLFLGLTAIRLYESPKVNKPLKIIGIILLSLLSCIGDWLFMDVLGCLFVHIYHDKPKAKWTAFTLTFLLPNVFIALLSGLEYTWFQFGVLLVPLMLYFLYNGKSGSKAKIHKWFFYFFYPAHLLILGILRQIFP